MAVGGRPHAPDDDRQNISAPKLGGCAGQHGYESPATTNDRDPRTAGMKLLGPEAFSSAQRRLRMRVDELAMRRRWR